ncbi:MAG: TolC family protein [Coleofasciculaceae cyanobacterium]
MSTFHQLAVLGVGAAIALSCMEPSASQDLPLDPQPTDQLTDSQLNLAELSLPSLPTEESSTATGGETAIMPLHTYRREKPPSSGSLVEHQASQVTVNSDVDTDWSSVNTDGSDLVVNPSLELAVEKEFLLTPAEAIISAIRQQSWQSKEKLADETLAQFPNPENPSLIEDIPDVSVPEFLNPSANPLLFPTETDEVEVKTTQPITLQQAIALARRNNRQLQSARLNLERAEQALREALAAKFPTAGISTSLTRDDSANTELGIRRQRQLGVPDAQINDDTVTTSLNATLQLSYDLYTGGRRPAQIRAAEEQVRLQQLEVERVYEEILLNITSSYYALQQADAQIDIFEAAVTASEQNLRDAQLLEQAGLGTRFDVLQQDVQLADDRQSLISARSQQRISRRQLVNLLSLDQQVEITAADPIEKAGEWDKSLEESIILALQNRAELQQQLAQRNISEQQRRIALSTIKPQATLSASYNALEIANDEVGAADGFTLQATLQWNFFDGGAAKARARQEEVNGEIAETGFAQQLNQTRFEVEQAFFNLNANEENIDTAELAVNQAEESLRLARLRFQAGVGTQTDVINQQRALTDARFNRLRAILDYNRALAELQRAISNLPDNNLFDLP